MQAASGAAMYGPIWVHLWNTTFIEQLPLLKRDGFSKEIMGRPLVTPELLAFFDACVATAAFAQNIAEAEKLVPTQLLVPKFVAEHAHADARELREKLMQKTA